MLRCPKVISVKVVVEDRDPQPAEAIPLILDKEEEVLISDKLASNLMISIEDAAEGKWRFRDEPLKKN